MKRIGILTLHIGDNYGAHLQCYALRKVINDLNNCHADIINYDPGRIYPLYEDVETQAAYQCRLEKLKTFLEKFCDILPPSFTDIRDPRAQGYDYYITGSDQVWNTGFSFAKETYFLDFVPDGAKRISYAASIGLPPDSPRLKEEWFSHNIPQLDAVSIREKTHVSFLKRYTEKEVVVTADPTMLLTETDYDKLCENVPYPKEDYIVLHFLKHDKSAPLLLEFANMLSRKTGYQVMYSFADVPSPIFKNPAETYFDYGPQEFVQLIRHAKAVVTNSFHATVLSLIFHVPFFTYIVGFMSSRITDLLEETRLEDRVVRGYRPMSDDMLKIDFSYADNVLASKRKSSIMFLKEALEAQ